MGLFMAPRPARWLKALGLDRKELWAWALYDWANSAFATTVMVAVMPIFFANVAAANLEPNMRTAAWGYTSGVSMFLIAFLGPILGVVADRYRAKKKFLGAFTGLGVFATAALYGVQTGDWVFAVVCYTLGHIGFQAANIFYESLLPHIASDKEIHRVSTAGYAIGYIGGGVLLAINLVWIMKPEMFGFADKTMATRYSFVSVAIWWAVFSLPLMRWVPEPPASEHQRDRQGFVKSLAATFSELKRTFRNVKQYRNAFLFLLAFWAFSDGIGTIMKMATIYGLEVGLQQNDLIAAILMVQFVGIPATFLIGALTDKIGPKVGLYFTLAVYTGITFVAYFMTTSREFWILAGGVALVQGGSQALSRSIYAVMIPRKHSAEFFGFYGFSSKLAGVVGPMVMGLISQMTGNSRSGILVVFVLFVIGIGLLTQVNVAEGMKQAQNS